MPHRCFASDGKILAVANPNAKQGGQQSRIFDRFHRVEGTRGRTHEGIGLALGRELIEPHKRGVGVERIVDKGTTLTVRVPIRSAYVHQPKTTQIKLPQHPQHKYQDC
jgi:light-regulated signal transduction histidine kinase (bacteriophytochrome)